MVLVYVYVYLYFKCKQNAFVMFTEFLTIVDVDKRNAKPHHTFPYFSLYSTFISCKECYKHFMIFISLFG